MAVTAPRPRRVAGPATSATADGTGQAEERWELGYRPGLDGMRGVGMAAMLLYHAEISWSRGAFLALSQFFTLSGFLVTCVLLRSVDRHGGLDVRRFWTRRARRLWPASLAGLGVIAVYGATVADASQAEALPKQVAAAALNVANWLFIAEDTSYVDQFAAPSPVRHFWSLSIEEQFYLLVPLCLLAFFRFTRSRRVLGAAVATLAVVGTGWMVGLSVSGASVDRIYYGTDTRIPEILTGVLLGVVLSSVRLPRSSRLWHVAAWVGAAAYALSIWMIGTVPLTEPAMWRGGIVAFSLLSCLVILGILGGTGPLRVLAWSPLAAMGRIAYGLYIYHLPIFLWLTSERTGLSQWPLLGLRLAVTFAVATASYHLLEMPIRSGTLRLGRLRLVLGPATAIAIVLVTVVTAGRGAEDRFATLQGDGTAAAAAPTAATDPVLDVLVITDDAGRPIAERLVDIAATDEALEVVDVGSFECGRLVGDRGSSTCSAWSDAWPSLVEAHDPDVVFLYTDTRAAAGLEDMAEAPGVPLAEVVGSGLDLLSVDGATVVWGSEPESLEAAAADRRAPFRVAMESLLHSRTDLRATNYLPAVPANPDEAYLARVSDTVLEGLRAHRRAPARDVPRVMIVGDSQARSVGYGLELFESDTGGAVVWNLATPGCGIAVDGTVRDAVTEAVQRADDDACVAAVEAWSSNVAEFDPDVVLVLSSLRDVQDRRLDGDADFGVIGDSRIDDHLVGVYTRAVDTLSGGGATVVWMKPPCLRYVSPFGGGGEAPAAFEPQRIERLKADVLPVVAQARPDMVLFGLDEILCPGGDFLESTAGLTDIRPDGAHLSVDASVWLAEILHRDVVERYG
jgi:peptidoglycan/LPS O-acetylase OafA/YrhL